MLNFLFKIVALLRKYYWFIFRPITYGVKIIVVSDGKFLLIKNRYDKYWYLPGGGKKRGESTLNCARREIKEECGIMPKDLTVIGIFTSLREHKRDEITLLYTNVTDQNLRQGLEIERLGFFEINSLPENTSSTTRRRIEEYVSDKITGGQW